MRKTAFWKIKDGQLEIHQKQAVSAWMTNGVVCGSQAEFVWMTLFRLLIWINNVKHYK